MRRGRTWSTAAYHRGLFPAAIATFAASLVPQFRRPAPLVLRHNQLFGRAQPFAISALPLLQLLCGMPGFEFHDERERAAWAAAFGGMALVAAGSAYNHWAPSNQTLVWDRLPITVAFMALTSAAVSETISVDLGAALLPPLLIFGAASVGYWHLTDDLTPYALTQGLPLLLLPALLLAFAPRYSHAAAYLLALLLYALAKVCELRDAELFEATKRRVSGHTLKHLVSAAVTLVFYVQLLSRTRRDAAEAVCTV